MNAGQVDVLERGEIRVVVADHRYVPRYVQPGFG
jgi:hypothetical protein